MVDGLGSCSDQSVRTPSPLRRTIFFSLHPDIFTLVAVNELETVRKKTPGRVTPCVQGTISVFWVSRYRLIAGVSCARVDTNRKRFDCRFIIGRDPTRLYYLTTRTTTKSNGVTYVRGRPEWINRSIRFRRRFFLLADQFRCNVLSRHIETNKYFRFKNSRDVRTFFFPK